MSQFDPFQFPCPDDSIAEDGDESESDDVVRAAYDDDDEPLDFYARAVQYLDGVPHA